MTPSTFALGNLVVAWELFYYRLFDSARAAISIPAGHLERIFDRFYQVDGTMQRRYGGSGLGLALVKEIVEKHGGRVDVESEVGKGSTFTIWLPAIEESLIAPIRAQHPR